MEELKKRMADVESATFNGECHDCKKPVAVLVEKDGDEIREISGGAIYFTRHGDFFKCDECFGKKKKLDNFAPCEVYTRCVGYLRPIKQMNPGKQAEIKNRRMFKVESI